MSSSIKLNQAYCDGDGDELGDKLLDGLCELEGEAEADGLSDGLELDDGLTEADGETEAEGGRVGIVKL